MESKEPYDILKLPTKGIFYKNRIDRLKVKYISAIDEDILNSRELMASGKVFEEMYNLKVINKDELSYNELMTADKLAFMIFMRKNSYGSIYSVNVLDPFIEKLVEKEVDLDILLANEPIINNIVCDSRGEFDFTMPKSKASLKFRILTAKEEEDLETTSKKMRDMFKLKTTPYLAEKKLLTIMEVNGERDKIKIKNFLEDPKLSITDTRAYREYYAKIEPNLNLEYEFESEKNKEKFKAKLPLSFGFFFPELGA